MYMCMYVCIYIYAVDVYTLCTVLNILLITITIIIMRMFLDNGHIKCTHYN